ncbi:UDP-glucose:GDP-mannose dehydrogenase (lipopolysaccharide biosynthesis) [Oceanobacillus iheyensis HTE831]|uniref:UDP-glucose:GDP-mannose dehydrogenase (Lipopolysaccharide biosynthesis) n=1 Tax=Oceanobacillus iheyensis (strain DSM 14371 / CIP 107618 / JCM 11309 / KCTC 3954 / HTE831) TaxID=221109 RepID=Q8CX86_OCEIH|nr:nucleotide sugar dehydrogenase [Oceanobacillus iheyensis]BAC14851.1 UDP-glucose:GDP-mannose dehydrogenase (lipopolysaccharide biosynthesis) [Oceanobacillus iheyensis HTE831]
MTINTVEFKNSLADRLTEKINNKSATLGVVGLGYVGLPLAVEKAKAGYKVIGFDVQLEKIEKLAQGINYIGDVNDEELIQVINKDKFYATNDYSLINNVDVVVICVPTPLDIHKQADISYVESATAKISQYLHKGMLVVLESTTYPGTTEEVLKPLLEESGLKCGEDFFLAYSPERVDPGNKQFNTANTPKVVGGITKSCTKVAATMYRNVLQADIHEVSTPAVAEMEKILENTFRNINIGLANEMAILCNKMGIDVWEVIDAAATKPYGFMPFYPGPGLGGHCIPIDPWYLTWKAREFNYHTKLIETAGEINNLMPDYVINRCMDLLNKEGKALNGSNILVLGVAYKKDIDDFRESPVISILEQLERAKANWNVIDPNVQKFTLLEKEYSTNANITNEILSEADLVLITTDHNSFDYKTIAENTNLIFDTRNAIPSEFVEKSNYYKL